MSKATAKINVAMHPLLKLRERIAIFEEARGIWKRRKPDPIQELRKMRKEWDRKLPRADK